MAGAQCGGMGQRTERTDKVTEVEEEECEVEIKKGRVREERFYLNRSP